MTVPMMCRWAWRKSSRSTGNGQCVELAFDGGAGALRDSKNPTGPMLVVASGTLTAFVAAAKLGKLDLR
ncbi:DUF397 domain-containing protein [Streptoalloteichus tenebrarius]|uniref:DUF397 domain-containing protein n=1 Tax=Streptoalloteichus tenebrarius (strain ATCC 17920 / DSM 40477 / JCM 4838 / CBS 697.72 / NBRC 16177 / NCIMB 11028 / NRRL B-12390 / A12253. 1 / ISP 5477) TaxID=1933 RepID=UPI0035ECDB75|nr:hypothetical protein GCM10020241_45960 [Streptoalloteichus tenebrarius]